MRYILTFDIGTTAVKTCLFDESLRCVSSANEEYTLITGPGNTVELDPETYINACRSGIRATAEKEGLLSQVAAVCITTQGETLIPIDEAGQPLRNAIVWLDTRAEAEAAFIKTLPFAADLFRKTGIPTMKGNPWQSVRTTPEQQQALAPVASEFAVVIGLSERSND